MHQRSRLLALALAPTLFVGACSTPAARGVETIHQPVVSRTDYAIDLGTSGNRLSPGESERLSGWMAGLRIGFGDRVSVDDPARTGAAADVAREAGRYGLLLERIAPPTPQPLPPGAVRVVVSRTVATVPGCPDYSHNSVPSYDQHTSSNHGCSINGNLAAMIANPEDLVRGQTGDPTIDPSLAAKAIRTYRDRTGGTVSGGGAASATETK